MPRNLNIDLYLRPFSTAVYGKLSNYFFLYFFEAINLALRQKIVQNLLIFVYLFFRKNSTIDQGLTNRVLVLLDNVKTILFRQTSTYTRVGKRKYANIGK